MMKRWELSPKKIWLLVLYGGAFAALTIFLFWKCRYGYANNDESFYLTIPYRMCQGDGLVIHEWHLSQLSALPLYPAVRLYLWVFGSTEGILLRFRLLFTLCWALSALFFCYRLRKFSLPGAMLASLAHLIYAPFGIMALSYNSMGILFLTNAFVLFATAERKRHLQCLFAGIFLANAILCCPYLVLLYLVFLVVSICRWKKDGLGDFGMVTLGCLAMLAVLCICLLRHASIPELVRAFPELFNDPEHGNLSLLQKTRTYFEKIWECNRFFGPCFLAAVLVTILSKLLKKPGIGLAVLCVLAAIVELGFLIENPYLNYVMFPISLLAPCLALHSRDKAIRLPFWLLWIPGLVYTYCIHLSSNQKFYAISSAATVMTVATIVMLVGYLEGRLRESGKKACTYVFTVAAAALLGLQFYAEISLRYSSVFWEEGGMAAQTVRAKSGPEKGILMTKEKLEKYRTQEKNIALIRKDPEIQKVLFLSRNTRLYLSTEKEMATYSAWLSGVDKKSVKRLDTYFQLCPDKWPDAIYIESLYTEFAAHYEKLGYEATVLDSGAVLLKRK